MTRINIIPPAELCDQHLLAEHRELTRIPNLVAKGKFSLEGQPSDYKLGTGHVKFFFDKMQFLFERYNSLHEECLARGFNVKNIWPENLTKDEFFWKNYIPTESAILKNRERIKIRMPEKPRFTARKNFYFL